MGTPQYMSPEQARGGKEVDRRADVYGLGATLYEVLGGRPPFDGNTLVDVLMKVVYEEPEPLRRLAPAVPVDLETIVMKCLEKDPARRYDTARGLAEDLRRFLDGEPVTARRAGAAYKLAKKMRKHRALVAVAGAALVAAGGLGTVSYQQRRDAAERARLAQQLGQEVAQMESGLRYAHLAPLHDTRLERERMRARMKDLELRMAKLGPIAEGAARYALGRGHLALREWDAARRDLEAAFAAGQRAPEVRYALGQTLGALYQAALAEAERDASTRDTKRKELERTLRDPALDHLRAAKAAEMESPEYAEGLIALYERRWENALAKAQEALAKNPLLYEAERLAGDVHQAEGREKQRRGDWDGASWAYGEAQSAYDRAAQIGRSDPSIYEGSCVTWVQDLQVVPNVRGDLHRTASAAQVACDRALTADPESATAHDRKAVTYLRVAEYLLSMNLDPREQLRLAIATAEQLTRVQPESYLGYLEGGNGWELLSEWQDAHGEDPLPAMDKAIALLRKAVEIAPWHSRTWDDLGMAVWKKAGLVNARGGDATPDYDEAVRDEREAVKRDPTSPMVHNNLANALSDRAFWAQDHGQDTTAWNDEAIAEYRRSIEINPNWASAYSNMGTSLDLRGLAAQAAGRDPRADWDQAFAAYKRSTEIQPKFANAWANGADVLTKKGAWEIEHAHDAAVEIGLANEWLAQAQKLRPGNAGDFLREAELGILEARQGAREKGLARAETAIARAKKENANSEDAPLATAEVERWRAEWAKVAGKRADVRRGLAAVAEAEKRRPGLGEAALLRGLLLSATGEKAQAIAALEEARRRKPALAHEVAEAIKKLE
jgi:serine/threonine-protein kinase